MNNENKKPSQLKTDKSYKNKSTRKRASCQILIKHIAKHQTKFYFNEIYEEL